MDFSNISISSSELIAWCFFIISFVVNITYFIKYRKTHIQEVYKDKLTNLYNRKAIDNIKDIMIDSLDKKYHVIYCDIDFFKLVNDTHGHNVGDIVLKRIGSILNMNFREKKDFVIRAGGEEFICFLESKNNDALERKQIHNKIEELREYIQGYNISFQVGSLMDVLNITMSFGIAYYDSEKDIEELIDLSDKALYKSKTTGRNKITISE